MAWAGRSWSATKRFHCLRSPLVIAKLPERDVILCQITSKYRTDGLSVPLDKEDFANGGLSFIDDKSENGKGMMTTSPFTNSSMLHLLQVNPNHGTILFRKQDV